jgi:D-lactate dehydrogenase
MSEFQSRVHAAMDGVATVEPMVFSTDPATCEMYWKVRKGTFPAVGAMRRTGTTVIIEDVAFPIASLADATLDLQTLLRHHGYHEAIIFGHALEGNLHFVFTQDFGDQAEIDRYARFMDDIVRSGGQQIRRLAEGRARHRPQHGALCRDGMGQGSR